MSRISMLGTRFLLRPALLLPCVIFFSGEGVPQSLVDDSLSAPYREALARLSTPELEARVARRREMQQKGYADALFHTLRGDGLWAAIATARSRLQLEYSLPRAPIILYIPIRQPEKQPGLPGFTGAPSPPMAVPLREDRQFPADPWEKH